MADCTCQADLLAEATRLLEEADKAARTRSLKAHEGILRRQGNALAMAAGWLGKRANEPRSDAGTPR